MSVLSQSLNKQDGGLRFGAEHYYASSDAETFTKPASTFDLIINTVSALIAGPVAGKASVLVSKAVGNVGSRAAVSNVAAQAGARLSQAASHIHPAVGNYVTQLPGRQIVTDIVSDSTVDALANTATHGLTTDEHNLRGYLGAFVEGGTSAGLSVPARQMLPSSGAFAQGTEHIVAAGTSMVGSYVGNEASGEKQDALELLFTGGTSAVGSHFSAPGGSAFMDHHGEAILENGEQIAEQNGLLPWAK
ncbi:hypothetical protein [Arthrobacter jiangjiafuii]|uniref:hypothetical protein n=1 Tax=Arthrobacter jiangjiafuii TaxID=2817475 RepID=UPI003B589256